MSKSWQARAARLASVLWADLSLDLADPDTAPALDWLMVSEREEALQSMALTLARDNTVESWELGAALGALCTAPRLAALSLRLAGVAKGISLGVLGALRRQLQRLELRLSWRQTAQHIAEQEWAQLVS